MVYKTYAPSEDLWISCCSALHKENKFVLTRRVERIGQMEYGKDKRGKDLNREKRKLNELNVTFWVNKFALNWAKLTTMLRNIPVDLPAVKLSGPCWSWSVSRHSRNQRRLWKIYLYKLPRCSHRRWHAINEIFNVSF